MLARWSTFLPEETVQAIIQQREWVAEARRIEEWIRVPNFAYDMPRLTTIEQKPEVFAMAIDTDGWIYPRRPMRCDKIAKKDRWLYKYEALTPHVGFATTDLKVAEKVSKMMIAGIWPADAHHHANLPSTVAYIAQGRLGQ